MHKFKFTSSLCIVLGLFIISSSVFAQETDSHDEHSSHIVIESHHHQTGGSNGGGGGDIILFDLVNTAVHAAQGGTGSTYTVWRGSDPYDSPLSDMTSMDGTTEGRDRFERYKPHQMP